MSSIINKLRRVLLRIAFYKSSPYFLPEYERVRDQNDHLKNAIVGYRLTIDALQHKLSDWRDRNERLHNQINELQYYRGGREHASGCSNWNVLRPECRYQNVEECGCNHG